MKNRSPLKFELQISSRLINRVLFGIAIISFLFLFGTWLQHKQIFLVHVSIVQHFLFELSLSKENHAAAWYSSMLLFTTALAALLCYWADVSKAKDFKNHILNAGWLGIAAVFFLLSFDEMGSFHEMIGETGLFKQAGGGDNAGWYAFYVLIGLVAAFFLLFFVLKFRKNWFSFALATFAVLLLLSNPFQEKLEISSWKSSPDPDNWRRPVSLLLLEEGSEIVATICFIYSFINYALGASSIHEAGKGKVLRLQASLKENFVLYLAGLLLTLGAIMWVIQLNAWNLEGDDNGIPANWPPAAISFLCFLVCVYLHRTLGNSTFPKVFLILGITTCLISLYFGSNIYGYQYQIHPYKFFPYLMVVFTAIVGFYAAQQLRNPYAKICVICWSIIMVSTIIMTGFAVAFAGLISSSSLLFALFFSYREAFQQVPLPKTLEPAISS